MNKDIIRKEIKQLRKALSTQEIQEKSDIICEKLFLNEIFQDVKTVMAYISSFKEVQTERIIKKLFSENIRVCAPVSDMNTETMCAYEFDDISKLQKGAYGILEPPQMNVMKLNEIDAVIVPGIAFDKQGNRMGFGAGYYDKFLSEFSGLKVGICYAFQLLEHIPSEEHDIKMNYIVTEEDIYVI